MITSEEIGKLKTRLSFRTEDLTARISASEPILFMPVDINDNDQWQWGNPQYNLRLYGTLENGDKACVHLDKVSPYFDYDISAHDNNWRLTSATIAADPRATARVEIDGIARMRAILIELEQNSQVASLSATWQYPLHGFTLEKHLYIRVEFRSLQARSRCIRTLRESKHVTSFIAQNPNILAHDDTGYNSPAYFNTIAREYHFSTAGWNIMRNYTHSIETKQPSGSQIHNFTVSVHDFNVAPAPRNDEETVRRMLDPVMSENWDIEVEHDSPDGGIPNVGDNYTITTISLVYTYAWREEPLATYVLSIYPCMPSTRENVTFIICPSEQELLKTCARISQRMLPDMRVTFNGANFDWKLFNDKVQRYGICGEILQCMDLAYVPRQSRTGDESETERYATETYKRKFTSVRVKINAENTHECACVALFAGALDIDIMPAMRRIFKNEEVKFAESLNKYLARAGLPPKDDIYFKVMIRMFQRARALLDPRVPRQCHCASMNACPFCSKGAHARVRELDFAIVNPDQPMSQWQYRDGHDGTEPVLRDPSLAKCCACGARAQNLRDITKINDYCAIDSIRPPQLLRKLGVIGDNRELSNTTFTSLFDSFYHADGMRVVNFIGSFARDFGIAITSRAPERPRARFQGAHVFPPVLGIHDRPVTALDFSSLYPSLMLAYNISPDTLITSQATADALAELGYELHQIEPFEYEEGDRPGAAGNVKKTAFGWTVRHGGILAPHTSGANGTSGTPPPTTIHYDADNNEIRGRPALDREHLGLFGFALRFLLDARKAVRAEQGRIEDRIKAILAPILGKDVRDIELDMPRVEDQSAGILRRANGDVNIAALQHDVNELAIKWRCLESKQRALKVLANTFYGQLGSSISTCYSLICAAGVTAAGRYNILRVANKLRELGYVIVYGDTDSVYTRAPEHIYAEIDAEWAAHRDDGTMTLRDYWGAQVIAARADMDKLRVFVSAFLRADNRTRFLNMAYEEVGMPSAFFGKKKYVLRPHVKGLMFDAKPMVRGLETVKQGRAPIVRLMGNSIIEDVLAIREEKNIIDIVTQRVNQYYRNTNPDLAHFIQFKAYKPAKRNIPVNRFVERMRDRYMRLLHEEGAAAAAPYTPPEAGDKFQYVIVDRAAEVTLSGHCIDPKVGDKMEYPIAVTSGKAQIDRQHYMDGALMSLFARFISSDARFTPGPSAPKFDPENDYTPYDEWRQAQATQFLREICAQYQTTDRERIHAVARQQRTATGAFGTLIQQAARDVNLFIDNRVARLLTHDRIRNIAQGRPGDRITDEKIRELTDLIAEIAIERSAEAQISENETIEAYAHSLEQVYTPSALVERYSREHYTRHIITAIGSARDQIYNEIKMDYASRLIAMYRSRHIDEVLSGIATNATEKGLKGKTQLMPEIGRALAFDKNTLELLHNLSRLMATYSTHSSNLRREALMRDRYAIDKAPTKK